MRDVVRAATERLALMCFQASTRALSPSATKRTEHSLATCATRGAFLATYSSARWSATAKVSVFERKRKGIPSAACAKRTHFSNTSISHISFAGNWASFGCWADPSYVDPSTVIVIEGDSSTPSLQVDSDATSLLSTTVDPIPVATTDAPCHMSLMGQHIHPIANFKSIQYDAAQMCGYVSMHGAVCDFTCQDSVRTGGKLTCNNGVWVKDESNPPQCLEIVDVPRGAVAAPTLTEDPNNEDGFIIHWERPLTCQGSTPTFVDGVETTVHVCSPAHGYRFVVKNLLNNGDVGGDAPLQVRWIHSRLPHTRSPSLSLSLSLSHTHTPRLSLYIISLSRTHLVSLSLSFSV